MTPLFKLQKFSIRYWKEILFFFTLGYSYIAFHELVHYFTLRYFGYEAVIKWSFWIARVISNPSILLQIKYIVGLMPYIFSLFFILILYLYRKEVYIKITSSVIFIDISSNLLLGLPSSLILNKSNDFLIPYYLGHIQLIGAFYLITVGFWILTVFEKKFR